MGQRPSMQQPEVVRRPRTSSDLANSSTATSTSHRHRNQRNGTAHHTARSQLQQQNSSSSSNTSFDEDNRSEEDASGNVEFASVLLNHLGLDSSAPSNNRNMTRRSEGESGNNNNNGSSSLFHNRSNPIRFGGSQRLRGTRSSTSASTGELLINSRLNAFLQNLDASSSAQTSSSGTSLRSMGAHNQQQQAVLQRLRHSFMLQLLGRDINCPVCHKNVPSDDAETHLILCLTKPVLSYNDDVLTVDKGECSICLDDMCAGDQIARLPCLCIYHKNCIDEWFKRKNTCPEHPPADDD